MISQSRFLQDAGASLANGGTISSLIDYAGMKQTALAGGGITVNVGTQQSPINVEVSTDTASLILLQGATTIAASNSGQNFEWVPNNNVPITLTAAQITAMFAAASGFIQTTFTALSTVIAGINAGTITTSAQIDAAAWPANS